MSYPSRTMAERYINAAKDGYMDVLQHATKRDLNTPDEDGMTAVTWAARNGHLDALRLIVGRGGDVERSDYLGLTPLHHAAQRGLMHVLTYLVNWGANLFALDNGHHTALDLASLHSHAEAVQYLDSASAQQLTRNPKTVAKLRDKAVRQAEDNIRRYEKLQDEAQRRAEKQQKKFATVSSRGSAYGGENGPPQRKGNLFQTLTKSLRGTKAQQKMSVAPGKSYSDIAGISHTTSARGGVAKRINQRKSAGEINGIDNADFKVSDLDEKGNRTLRSLNAAQGVISGKSSDVMYLTGQRNGGTAISADTARPTAYEVFRGHNHSDLFKSKSEPDLLDSGNDSYFGDEDDDDNMTGMFNRPGFGRTAFLTNSQFVHTLVSFDGQGEEEGDAHEMESNGQQLVNGSSAAPGSLDDGLGDDVAGSWRGGARELPWDQEEVDTLDDDDDPTTSSALEMFLWSAGLETYLHKFLQEKVDMELLLTMSDSDLKEIHLPFGPRKRLLEAIERRHKVLALPKHMTDSFL